VGIALPNDIEFPGIRCGTLAIVIPQPVCITSPLCSRCSILGFSCSSTLAAKTFGNFIASFLALWTPMWLI
jgi:hypothetical protein